ncbi:hypothetical protein KVH31_34650 [Streptomyces olivaceus]|uniref:hypothetical protein n=1 Tax=Streptomyces olivaceus TaxID=47716 RepID=UPI001CCFDD46|nr:hypothetical protein [Streptomyces olivaceus]MBZ6211638.1 hypothetical protein [Streptomyces olivaceus]
MAKLVTAVFVRDPERNRTVVLHPGEEPAPHLAALVTNPDAWEDGKLPDTATPAATTGGGQDSGDDSTDKPAPPAKPAARKPAAKKPARGRDAADEGSSGE